MAKSMSRGLWALVAVGAPGSLLVATLFVTVRLVTPAPALHVVPFDVLAQPDETVTLQARIEHTQGARPALNQAVSFLPLDQDAFASVTDDQGLATAVMRVDQPGRSIVELAFTATSNGQSSSGSPALTRVPGPRVFVYPASTPLVLCTFPEPCAALPPNREPETLTLMTPAQTDADRTLHELAATHLIVYICFDSDVMLPMYQKWLREREFPDGPLLVVPGERRSGRGGIEWAEWLKRFATHWPGLRYALVSEHEQADACHAAGVRSYLISASNSSADHLPASTTRANGWTAFTTELD